MRWNKILELTAYLSMLLLAGLFVALSMNVYVADSEFWSISLGYHFAEDFKNSWVYTRPLFYSMLWLSQLGFSTPSNSVFAARSLFCVNAVVIFFLMVKILRVKTRTYFCGILALVLLLGNTGFLNQGFRIRSDLLSTTLGLGVLLFLIIIPVAKRNRFSLLILLPVLATPKAILSSGFLGVFLNRQGLRQNIGKILLVLAPVVLVIAFFNIQNFDYLKAAFISFDGSANYFNLQSFFHVFNQFLRNPFFWVLFFLRFITCAYARENSAPQNESFYKNFDFEIFVALCFLLMLVYVEKVQFFIASLLPIFSIHVAMIAFDLQTLLRTKLRNVVTALIILVSIVTGVRWFIVNEENNSNALQLRTLDATYELLKKNHVASYYDFTCLIAPLCKLRYFVGPNQGISNRYALEAIIKNRPQVLLYIRKAHFIEPDLSRFLNSNYLRTRTGAYVLRSADVPTKVASQKEASQDKLLHKEWKSEDNILLGLDLAIANNLEQLFGYDVEY